MHRIEKIKLSLLSACYINDDVSKKNNKNKNSFTFFCLTKTSSKANGQYVCIYIGKINGTAIRAVWKCLAIWASRKVFNRKFFCGLWNENLNFVNVNYCLSLLIIISK